MTRGPQVRESQERHTDLPAPLWPVVVAGLAWLAGIGFLAAMAMLRFRTDAMM